MIFRPFGNTLGQHLIYQSYILPVQQMLLLMLQINNFGKATAFDFSGHIIVELFFGRCARSFRIAKHIGKVVLHLLHDAKRFLVIRCCFTTESGNDIGGNATCRKNPADGLHPFQVPFTVIGSVHPLQNGITP